MGSIISAPWTNKLKVLGKGFEGRQGQKRTLNFCKARSRRRAVRFLLMRFEIAVALKLKTSLTNKCLPKMMSFRDEIK